MAKVSVIVPVYNVEDYLRKCLDSLVNQTLKDMEILVVNDGTKDNSLAIMEEYAAKYQNVRIFSKENGGLSDARNFGVQRATGEYIGFVDSDDYVELNMYEILYRKARETDSDIVECNLYHDYPDSRDEEIGKKYQTVESMIMFGRAVVWNKIYRREWLLRTGIQFPLRTYNEDEEFYQKLLVHVKPQRYSYVDETLIHYVQRESSLNHDSTLKSLQILEVLGRIIEYYKQQNVFEKYHDPLEIFCARVILCSSFLRLVRIPDAGDRRYALDQNWQFLIQQFPDWKKNPYLKTEKGGKMLYLRCMNHTFYRILGAVLPVKNNISKKVRRNR